MQIKWLFERMATLLKDSTGNEQLKQQRIIRKKQWALAFNKPQAFR